MSERKSNFTISCNECGCKKVIISFKYSQGSEETGIYGEEIILKCPKCGRREERDV